MHHIDSPQTTHLALTNLALTNLALTNQAEVESRA